MTKENAPSGASFNGLGIAPKLLEILSDLKYTTPTPIQQQAIPHAVEGKDVVGVAQTGTGKTLAFGVPMLQRLAQTKGRGLVLLPTRELALQVEESLVKIGKHLGIRTAVLIGGASMGPQISNIRRDPHIIIATPGRLLDHMEQRTIKLDRISILVLDEADRMLDMGFWPQIKKIVAAVPTERQTMLFSATLSREVMDLASKQMKLPINIEVAPQGTTAERVTQEIFIVRKDDKLRLLEKVLNDYRGSTIVFTRTKHGATRVMKVVKRMGHDAAEIHGNRSLGQRREALDGFKSGKYRVLVATDIAARGIDVKGVELVVNYDLPTVAADYVHRIGRTARAGAEGHAISFAMPDEKRDVRDIERLIRTSLKVAHAEDLELPPARVMPSAPERSFTPSRSSGGRPQYGSSRPSFGGGRPSFGGSRPSSSSPRRVFNAGSSSSSNFGSSTGERRPFNSSGNSNSNSSSNSSSGGFKPRRFGTSRPPSGGRRFGSSQNKSSGPRRFSGGGEGNYDGGASRLA